MDDQTFEVHGRAYAVIPEWILDAEISASAVRLFATLGRFVGANDAAFPSRRTLAARMHCSVATVDRALSELKGIGAIKIEAQTRGDGSRTSSLFYLWPLATPLPTGDGTPHHGRGYPSSPVIVPPLKSDIALKNIIERTTSKVSSPRKTEFRETAEESFSGDVIALTAYLNEWIGKNGFKPFTEGKLQWRDMDKILRIDKRPPHQVREVIDWCQRDSFWNSNVRSVRKLRQHFDTFLGKMRNDGLLSEEPSDLSDDQTESAMVYESYDSEGEWYDSAASQMRFDNPITFGYNRPRNAKGQPIDTMGRPYTIDAQGVRRALVD